MLLEPLESILNQQRQPDELVVCDDGSTDSTLELLREFQSVAPIFLFMSIAMRQMQDIQKILKKPFYIVQGT